MVSASADKTIRIWDLDRGRALAPLRGHAGSVLACVVIPDGRRVISSSEDQTLKVWSLDTGRALASLQGHTSLVTACSVTRTVGGSARPRLITR